MKNYKGFTILEEYPTDEKMTEFVAFVWDKRSHYKAHIYGKDITDTMWNIGDTVEETVKTAIDDYWEYEIYEYYYDDDYTGELL